MRRLLLMSALVLMGTWGAVAATGRQEVVVANPATRLSVVLPVDATAVLQAAFDSDREEVVIGKAGSPWIVDPLFIRKPKKVVFEPGVELIAKRDGLFLADTQRLRAINSLGRMMIATRPAGTPVKAGDKLCGTRIIPLVIEKEAMAEAARAAGETPLLQLKPMRAKKFGVVTTGNEVFHGRIQDTFTPVLQEKLAEYGCEMIAHEVSDDDHARITRCIRGMLDAGAEMVLCTGGMSVDPDDKTPLAIKSSGARIVSYGAPVLPGAMFLLSYMEDGRPVCGLPGCVMYAKRTIFDIVLPYLLADVPVTADMLAGLGNGGLCLNCSECHYPNCGFGKWQ